MFTKDFDKYACHGDTITCEVDGFTVTARIEHDSDAHIDDDDTHPAEYNADVFGKDTPANRALFEKALAARKAWFDNEWFYCGIVLDVRCGDVMVAEHAASLWHVDVNHPESQNGNAYLREVANELLPEALDAAREAMATAQAKLAAFNPFDAAQGKTYTRAEIRNGTGWPKGARFALVSHDE